MSVRVAVIDSGANPTHPHITRVAGGVCITATGDFDREALAWIDKLGHGTAVLAAIQEKAPDATYFAVKVFHDALQTRAVTLVRALDWCIDTGIDVVNLSLGTLNATYADAFEDAIARCARHGILVVAAREANGSPCYPGCLPHVFGVVLDWDVPRDTYRAKKQDGRHVFYASGHPRPIPGVALTRNLYGVSFAVANMCGFVVQACGTTGARTYSKIEAELIRSEIA